MAQKQPPRGICDVHPLMEQNILEIKEDITEIKKSQEEIKAYIIQKKAENGITQYIAQQRGTQWDRVRNWGMLIIAVSAILVSIYSMVK
jgi:hypothetical protein